MDNGSTDGSADYVREAFPTVKVVDSPRNLGTAEGNNAAARHATGDYLFLLNNDAFVDPDTISTLLETAARNPSAAIIGCQVLNLDGSIQDLGEKIDALGFPVGIGVPSDPLPPVIEDLFFACSCAVLIRTDVFWKLGGYDNRYFFACEEVDLAWRVRLQGYTVLTDTRAIVRHVGGGSLAGGAPGKEARYRTNTRRIYLRERNTVATLLKNYSVPSLVRLLPLYVCINMAEMVFFCFLLRPSVSWQYVRSYMWNLRQLPDTLRARRLIQRGRCISDREIARYFWPGIYKLRFFTAHGIPRIDG